MSRSRNRTALLATAILAAASGCAHWQQNDAAGSAADGGLMAWGASVLGDGSKAPEPPTKKSPTHTAAAKAAPAHAPTTDAPVRLAAHQQVVRVAHKETTSCDSCGDACCDAVAEPMNCPCPILGACGRCSECLAGRSCKLFTRPEPGPPPVRYRPCMPPKFLPVPTQPILSPARPDAPEPWRGDVERGWRPQLTFPAHD